MYCLYFFSGAEFYLCPMGKGEYDFPAGETDSTEYGSQGIRTGIQKRADI